MKMRPKARPPLVHDGGGYNGDGKGECLCQCIAELGEQWGPAEAETGKVGDPERPVCS